MSSGKSRIPRRPSSHTPARLDLSQLAPSPKQADAESAQKISLRDFERITNPTLPGSSIPTTGANGTPRDPRLVQQELELKHDALMIVEQKVPNVMKIASADSNINRFYNNDARHEALRTLPLAFPPVRFRRGETVDEYIESVTAPWEEVRRISVQPQFARRASATRKSIAVEKLVLTAQEIKNETLRQRHAHHVSSLWRQTHATKAELLSAEETSKSLQRPLIDSCTQAAIACEQSMVAAMAVSCREGVHATDRGLVVPYQYYESLRQAVNTAVDKSFVSFFQFAQDDDVVRQQLQNNVTGANLNQLITRSSSGKKAPIAFRGALREQQSGSSGRLGIEDVELPEAGHPSRHSLVTVRTASNVCILWRMLVQVRSIVPGMDTALQIFEELLPLLYVDFDEVRKLLPTVSSLAEQIKQLRNIPLVCLELQRSEANEAQFKNDVEYLRKALENWGFTIWRNYNSIERRRGKHLESLQMWFARFQARRVLAMHFFRWRHEVIQQKSSSSMVSMEDRYRDFVKTSRHAAAETIPMSMNRAIAANQARFHAQKLAATASHDKFGASVRSASPAMQSVAVTLPKIHKPRPPQLSIASISSTGGPSSSRDVATANVFDTVDQQPAHENRVATSPIVTQAAREPGTVIISPTQDAVDIDMGVSTRQRHTFFDEVLAKLQSVDDVSGHLREFIAIQRQNIDKLEHERRHHDATLRKVQEETMKLVKENLKLNNIIQERDIKIRDQTRQILRLKAKVRLHRHKNWRKASIKVLSDVLKVSNATIEAIDEERLTTDMLVTSAEVQLVAPDMKHRIAIPDLDADDGADESETETSDPSFANSVNRASEEERLFGRYAPLVLDAPTQLPDALVIITDWANNCLDDLQALDGVGGSSLSTRFTSLSSEVRDGIIFSRLLFYLALPRYQPAKSTTELDDVSPDFAVNRARLLSSKGVQLHSPFPTYDDCFGDLMRFPPIKRMNVLLNFASDLMSGTHRLTSKQVEALNQLSCLAEQNAEEAQRSAAEYTFDGTAQTFQAARRTSVAQRSFNPRRASKVCLDLDEQNAKGGPKQHRRPSNAFSDSDMSAAFPVTSEFLPQYVDPLLLCEGSKAAVVTFLSLLYVKFAHPFNHKANETMVREVEMMKVLLKDPSPGTPQTSSPQLPHSSPLLQRNGSGFFAALQRQGASSKASKLESLLSTIEEDEKSPWQTFLDRCKPMFASPSNPFVLDGNFWSSTMIDSAEMLEVFSSVVCALQRSLEAHRWHVTLMCITPMISNVGMTRGCFSGMYASTSLYLYQRSCMYEDVALNTAVVHLLVTQRKEYPPPPLPAHVSPQGGAALGPLAPSPVISPQAGSLMMGTASTPGVLDLNVSAFDAAEFESSAAYSAVMATLSAVISDLARVFLSRASVNQTMLTPTMTLASWRLMWMDTGICPEKISIDALTFVFSESCRSNGGHSIYNRASSLGSRAAASDPTSPLESLSSAQNVGTGAALFQEMSFDEFCEGVLRVAHFRYAPVVLTTAPAGGGSALHDSLVDVVPLSGSVLPMPAFSSLPSRANSAAKQKSLIPLHEAFARVVSEYLASLYPVHTPPQAIARIKSGVLVEDLLRRKNAELLSVFQAYAKVHLGIPALEKEDALRLVKDAGIATAELSYQVIADLFQECSFKRTAADQAAMNLMDPHHLDGAVSARGSIFGAGNSMTSAPTGAQRQSVAGFLTKQQQSNGQSPAQVDRQLIDFPAFVDFLCVLLLYKMPNPFVPMHVRLEHFLDRNVIAPLKYRVEQASRARTRRKETVVSLSKGDGAQSSTPQSVQQKPLPTAPSSRRAA